jgi:2-iminobutanoate/2-iminopropanoate deaminase
MQARTTAARRPGARIDENGNSRGVVCGCARIGRDPARRRRQSMSALTFHMIGGAPDPVAPFSHAVEADGWVFLTGQMPFTGTSNASDYPDTIEAQTHQVMKNLVTVLEGCGLGLQHVAAVRVFLRHFDEHYARMNAVYATWFPPGRRPARTCIGVTGLARGALIEIDMIARR